MVKYLNNPPLGFSYIADFLSKSEEQILLDQFANLNWQVVTMYGVKARRRVVHFGLDYIYNSRTISTTKPPPDFIQPLLERAAAYMAVPPKDLVETLITEYPIGAGIGWHRDAKIFGDKIFGLSLGSDCTLKLRKYADHSQVYKQILKPRSAYVLSGKARNEWEHNIPPVKTARYSITFRTLYSRPK